MLTKRKLIAGLTSLSLAALIALPASAQSADMLKEEFNGLSDFERRNVQVELQIAGLYTSSIDGGWGPGTQRALLSAPGFIHDQSYGRVSVPFSTRTEVQTFMKQIAKGEYSQWFYGEGEEG
jgi:hypothetical protein